MTYTQFNELLYCDIQIAHYSELVRRRCRGFRFVAAAFAWKRLQWYKHIRQSITNDNTSTL